MKRWQVAMVIALAIAIGGIAYIRLSPAVAQDACLDGGGRWEAGRCFGGRPDG